MAASVIDWMSEMTRSDPLGEAVVVRLGREHRQPTPASALGALDEHLLAVLRHVDRYQHGAGGCRRTLGHGRSASKVLSRQPHFRDLLAGHGLP